MWLEWQRLCPIAIAVVLAGWQRRLGDRGGRRRRRPLCRVRRLHIRAMPGQRRSDSLELKVPRVHLFFEISTREMSGYPQATLQLQLAEPPR